MEPALVQSYALPTVVLAWILLLITSVIIALRLYVRRTRLQRWLSDDYFMMLAWLCEVVGTIFVTVTWTTGIGQHIDDLSFEQIQRSMEYTTLLVEPFSIASSLFGRVAFCLLLTIVLERTNTWRTHVLWAVIILQILINSVTIVQILAQCGLHVAQHWSLDPAIAGSVHCQNHSVQILIGYCLGSINCASDLLLCIMPVMILWNLQLPVAQKAGIAVMLMLSIFACAASVAKTIFIGTLSSSDITWHINYLNLTQLIENYVVMIAASIPTLRPLLHRKRATRRTYASASKSSKFRRTFFSSHGSNLSGRSERYGRNSNASGQSDLELCTVTDGQIKKTTAYEVAWEPRTSADALGFEGVAPGPSTLNLANCQAACSSAAGVLPG